MRKLLTKKMVLAALAVVILSVSVAAADIGTGVVTATSLRMRSEPSVDASTIMLIANGEEVAVQEKLDGWYKIVYNEHTGYVSDEYVDFTAAPEAEAAPDETEEEPALPEEQSATATVNGNSVNFRAEPSIDAEVIAKLDKGTEIELLSTEDGWCQVVYDGKTGYISADYVAVDGVAVQNARGIVTGSGVNVRKGPSTNTDVVTKLSAGKIVDLLELKDGWYRIRTDGVEGFVSGDYIREYVPAASSAIGDQAAALAMSFLGVPYVYGGASPSGFDCSGLTLYVYKQFGYNLSHSASAQWANSGVFVERSELQPGDLVMFCDPSRSNGKACSHVGIYIGNNEFIHASSGSSGKYVKISSLSQDYYNRYYKGAKRIG